MTDRHQKRKHETDEQAERKRQKQEKAKAADLQNDCKTLLKEVKSTKDKEGRNLSLIFQQLPSRKDYPDYYEIIKRPIALSTIKTKMQNQEYSSLDEVKADFDLMFDNAMTYNRSDSLVYKDAQKLKKYVGKRVSELLAAASAAPSGETASETLAKHGDAAEAAQDSNPALAKDLKIRIKTTPVKKRIPKSEISELFDAIERKDIKQIRTFIQTHADAFDPNMLWENEMFGEKFTWAPLHCAAYSGSVRVVKLLMEAGAEVDIRDTWYGGTPLAWAAFGGHPDTAKVLIENFGADLSLTNQHGQRPVDLLSDPESTRWVGILTMMKGGEKKPVPIVESKKREVQTPRKHSTPPPALPPTPPVPPKEKDINDIMRELWKAVVDHKHSSGRKYSAEFMDLPDRREYPLYYQLIQAPISLNNIDKHLRKGYKNFDDFDRDMERLFNNAKFFNEDGSQIYKDAVLLQNLYEKTKRKLLSEKEKASAAAAAAATAAAAASASSTTTPVKASKRLADKSKTPEADLAMQKSVKTPDARTGDNEKVTQGSGVKLKLSLKGAKHNEAAPTANEQRKESVKITIKPTAPPSEAPRPAPTAPETGAAVQRDRMEADKVMGVGDRMDEEDEEIVVDETPARTAQPYSLAPSAGANAYRTADESQDAESARRLKSLRFAPSHPGKVSIPPRSQPRQPPLEQQPTLATAAAADPSKQGAPLLQWIAIESNDRSFVMSLDTSHLSHCVFVSSGVQSMSIIPLLASRLMSIREKVAMTVVQDGKRVTPANVVALPAAPQVTHQVYMFSLAEGLNSIEIWVSAQLGTGEPARSGVRYMSGGSAASALPQYPGLVTQQFYLFIMKG
ncbi:uncharacterized protein VTP21DRAFT_6227 [Calcarisporiella thermophila]|uniref:uncharacterized protein n=1 Tax=Calcarisporiella thermophila TaxID=911321 RepID=UPI003741FAA5